MAQLVEWTFTPGVDPHSPAVAGPIESTTTDKAMFPAVAGAGPIDTTQGSKSWDWPAMPQIKQKLVEVRKFDPNAVFFRRGAHMPLMIYVGLSSQTRRTPEASTRRAERADARGWGKERRQGKGQKGKGAAAAGPPAVAGGGEAASSSTRGGGEAAARASGGWGDGRLLDHPRSRRRGEEAAAGGRGGWTTRGGGEAAASGSGGWTTRGGGEAAAEGASGNYPRWRGGWHAR